MIDKKNLRTALIQSSITGQYVPVDDAYSARIRYDGHDVVAMVIDHGSLRLMSKVNVFNAAITHDTLTKIVDKVDAEMNPDEFNIMGIDTYADLLKRMREGLRFGEVMTYRDGTKHIRAVLYVDKGYIHWHNYGSSANRATAKDMKWVIETIFQTDLPRFIRKYIAF